MHRQKHSVCGCRESGILTVSSPQTACSAILHGFDRAFATGSLFFSVIFYNAERRAESANELTVWNPRVKMFYYSIIAG